MPVGVLNRRKEVELEVFDRSNEGMSKFRFYR